MNDFISKSQVNPSEDKDEENKDHHVIVTGWITEHDEKIILAKINEFIDKNGWRAKVKDAWCYSDPTNFGVIEFHTIVSTKAFLRGLAKATDMQIEEGKTMRFGRNRTLTQRANDKRLGLIKHLLAQVKGVEFKDIKIRWKANVISLTSETVYKKDKDGQHLYIGKANDVKDQVEQQIRRWLKNAERKISFELASRSDHVRGGLRATWSGDTHCSSNVHTIL